MYKSVSLPYLYLLIFICFCLISCAGKNDHIQRDFYHWQTELNLSSEELQELSDLDVQALYVKYFDVIWDTAAAQPRPVAKLQVKEVPPGFDLYPVIFLTNETLQQLDMEGVNDLAWRMCKLMDQIHTGLVKEPPVLIQIDCDWTSSTREKYFQLLRQMRTYKRFEQTVWSATIRLHQYARPDRTGVPPVDRGLLMFYNMGNIEDPDAVHSVYDQDIAASYLKQATNYPIPLDAGIALFSWGLYFHQQELRQIFYPLYADEMHENHLFEQADDVRFAVVDEGYFRGTYLVPGDTIRLESMTPDRSLRSAQQLAAALGSQPHSVVLYHTDPVILQRFSHEELDAIFTAFE